MSRLFVSQEIFDEALEVFDGTDISVDARRDHQPLEAGQLREAAAAVCVQYHRGSTTSMWTRPRGRVWR